MMSARKKQGLPPVQTGTQPRIFIRPHKGKQSRPRVTPAVPSVRGGGDVHLNDKVLQRPVPPKKNNKTVQKHKNAVSTKAEFLAPERLSYSVAVISAAVLAVAVLCYVAGVFSTPVILSVLVIGGGIATGGYFYGRLLKEKERLRQDYEHLRRVSAEKAATPSAEPNLPEALSTDAGLAKPPETFLEDLRKAAGTPYAATGTAAMAQRLKPAEEAVDFSSLSAAADVSDWPDAKVLRYVEEAITRNRIDMFIQPIVQLPQRKRRFYEMYSRIRMRPGVYLPAERYIPLVRQDGILPEIDNRLLLHALKLIQTANESNLNRSFFCNISPFTLNDRKFMADLLEFLTQRRLLAPRLVFELSQRELAVIDAETLRVLDGLSRLGCRFAMDGVEHTDFDFEKLQVCHIRYVKISAEVLMRVLSGSGGFTQLRRMKEAFDYYGIELIVEKIESERQLVEFLDLQIDYGQGYLFGEPRQWTPEKSARQIT